MESNFVKLAFFVLISCFCAQIQGTYFYSCEDKTTLGTAQRVKVTNCVSDDEDSKCSLKRGTNASIEIEFKTDVTTDTVTAVVHGIIFGEEKKFDLPNTNGCVDSLLTCPLAKDSVNTYLTSLPIKRIYPKLSVDVKFEIQNTDGQDIFCIIIPAKLA